MKDQPVYNNPSGAMFYSNIMHAGCRTREWNEPEGVVNENGCLTGLIKGFSPRRDRNGAFP